MQDFLLYLFSAITLLSALMVVASRDTVNSAMYMILAFVGTACLYVLLEAYFIAVLQVLVYAGAVMVLFLFIIMLLDVQEFARKKPALSSLIMSTIGFFLLASGVFYFLFTSPEFSSVNLQPVLAEPQSSGLLAFSTSAKSFGYALYTKYLLPFQVAGFLLLVAMVGVVLISKKLNPCETQ